MVDQNRSDLEAVRFHRHLDLERTEMQEGRHLPGECDEVGPHNVVENVFLHTIEGFGTSVNTWATLSRSPGILYKDRQTGSVIGMGVSEEHMTDGLLLLGSAIRSEATCINSHGSIYQVTADVLEPGGILHRRPEKPDFHRTTSAARS
jgi:hypothetical protein